MAAPAPRKFASHNECIRVTQEGLQAALEQMEVSGTLIRGGEAERVASGLQLLAFSTASVKEAIKNLDELWQKVSYSTPVTRVTGFVTWASGDDEEEFEAPEPPTPEAAPPTPEAAPAAEEKVAVPMNYMSAATKPPATLSAAANEFSYDSSSSSSSSGWKTIEQKPKPQPTPQPTLKQVWGRTKYPLYYKPDGTQVIPVICQAPRGCSHKKGCLHAHPRQQFLDTDFGQKKVCADFCAREGENGECDFHGNCCFAHANKHAN